MKLLLTLALFISFSAIANEAVKVAPKSEKVQIKNKKAAQDAYLKAKNECLAEDKEIKGKALKDCIVKKQGEAK